MDSFFRNAGLFGDNHMNGPEGISL